MEFDKDISSCYLAEVYTHEDNLALFNLTFSNTDYTQVGSLYTNSDGLKEVLEKASQNKWITDFNINEGLLVSNTQVLNKDISLFPGLEVNKIHYITSVVKDSFYDLLQQGSKMNYLFIPDDLTDKDEHVGSHFSTFKEIYFSNTTMTVMFRIISDNKMYNRNIVVLDGNTLVFKRFHYAVPKDQTGGEVYGMYVKDFKINNIDYAMYYTNELPLVLDCMSTSIPLLNKCVIRSAKYKNYITAINELLSRHLELPEDSTKVEWVGGSNSHKSDYGIYFDCPVDKMARSYMTNVVDMYNGISEDYQDNLAEVDAIIGRMSLTPVVRDVLRMINYCHKLAKSSGGMVSTLYRVKGLYEKLILDCDVYSYKLRVYAYMRGIHLGTLDTHILYGSEDQLLTKVKEGKFYAE